MSEKNFPLTWTLGPRGEMACVFMEYNSPNLILSDGERIITLSPPYPLDDEGSTSYPPHDDSAEALEAEMNKRVKRRKDELYAAQTYIDRLEYAVKAHITHVRKAYKMGEPEEG